MIGLGPHEMTTGLWAFGVGLTVVLAALAVLSVYIAVRATADPSRQATCPRVNPYPVPVVRTDARKRLRVDDREQTFVGG